MQTRTHQYRGCQWNPPLDSDLDSDSTLLLAFGARAMVGAEPFAELRAAFPRAHLVGCSTSGEILQGTLHDDSIVVAVLRFERSRVSTVSTSADQDAFEAGRSLATGLTGAGLRAVLVFSDGSRVNGSRLVAGLATHLAPEVAISGGFAGDGVRFESTWVLDGDLPAERRIAAVGLYGESLRVRHGSRGGWSGFGPERLVTRSDGNVLYELDGRPALQLYKDYLGERQRDLPAAALIFPLSVREADKRHYVRTILSYDETTQSMTFAGDIPVGSHVQLMRGNLDRIVEGASEAAAALGGERGGLSAVPAEYGRALCLAVTCVGRRMMLRERTEEELEAVAEWLAEDTPLVGFYSYGEISPLGDGTSGLHNQTMTLTLLEEA